MFDIDYVFPGVNNTDKVGRQNFINYCKKNQLEGRLVGLEKERYRDGGLLKYLFRAIAKNMPGIHKVHLIVSNIEQVPAGVNQEEVHIVLHKDFMPSHCLPTFNSTAIEMFLPYIPDLSEHFLYGNDDIYPMNSSQPDDWFTEEGLPKFKILQGDRNKFFDKQFRVVCRNEGDLLCRLTHTPRTEGYGRPEHTLSPLVKSKCIDTIKLLGNYLVASISRFRTEKNMNQYIYTDYLYLTNYYADTNMTFSYIGAKHPKEMLESINMTTDNTICLNDCNNNLTPMQLATLQVLCAQEFEKRFPEKCKYEN